MRIIPNVMNNIETLPSNGIQPNFKPGTVELLSYAVFNSKGIAEVSHETTAEIDTETRLACYQKESKGKAVLA